MTIDECLCCFHVVMVRNGGGSFPNASTSEPRVPCRPQRGLTAQEGGWDLGETSTPVRYGLPINSDQVTT